MFLKITVIPYREIVTTFVKDGKDGEIIKYIWENSKVRMNEDKTLYIYDLLERDINFEGGLMIGVIFRLDYTVQMIKSYSNVNGTILSTTSYTE